MRFMEIKQPTGNFLVVPEVSSEKRKYVPIGYAQNDWVCSNKVRYVSDATLYHLGILTSNVHMAWMRAVCGRLEMRYSYSINIVYNNFPWPTPTDAQKAKIEQTAQGILDARALYPDCSLADLYDEVTMPPELRKAHQQNRAMTIATAAGTINAARHVCSIPIVPKIRTPKVTSRPREPLPKVWEVFHRDILKLRSFWENQ